MQTCTIIVFSLFVYIIMGLMAADSLIGDTRHFYSCSTFGPFNVLKGKAYEDATTKDIKANTRRYIYCVIGGTFSLLFLIMYTIGKALYKLYEQITWAFYD